MVPHDARRAGRYSLGLAAAGRPARAARAGAEAPRQTEFKVLLSLSIVFLLATILTPLLFWLFAKHYDVRTDLATASMAVLTLGVLAGTTYRVGREYAGAQAALATEGVMIAAMLLGQVGYAGYRWSGDDLGTGEHLASVASTGPSVAGLNEPKFERIRWQFVPERFSGLIAASPLVHGDEVWVAAARTSYRQGTLFCLNRADGTKQAEFIGKDGNLKQMISSPVIADGRLYIGEGFHDDPRCRLFCMDVKERTEMWAFQTESQTEPAPCVAAGKVYFGAGNDGIYCVDAVTGAGLALSGEGVHRPAAALRLFAGGGGRSALRGQRRRSQSARPRRNGDLLPRWRDRQGALEDGGPASILGRPGRKR